MGGRRPRRWPQAVPAHYALLSDAVGRHGGVRPVEQGEGDSIVAAFSRASDALAAALDAQRALAEQVWPDELKLRVRIALHTGRGAAARRGQLLRRRAQSLRASAGDRARRSDAALAGRSRPGRRAAAGGRCARRSGNAPAARPRAPRARVRCSAIPTCRRAASRCARWTRCRTTCPSSSRASSAASGELREIARCARATRGC